MPIFFAPDPCIFARRAHIFGVFNAPKKFFSRSPLSRQNARIFHFFGCLCAFRAQIAPCGQSAVDLKQNRSHSRNAVKLEFAGILCPNCALFDRGLTGVLRPIRRDFFMSKYNIRLAKSPRDWYGFSVPEGAAFGSEYLTCGDFVSKRYYDFVYLGQSRKVKRPDGTTCGYEVKIFLHHHDDAVSRFDRPDEELFHGFFKPAWFFCAKGSLAEKLLNRHIKTVKRQKPDRVIK